MAAILSSRQTFLPKVIPEVEYTRKIAMSISKILAAILSSQQTFLPKVIPEVEYTRKIAMSISKILSFWSTL